MLVSRGAQRLINMRNKTRFIYIANNLRLTVSDSQIINWLELYEKQGIVFDLVIIPPGLSTYLKEYKTKKKKRRQASEVLNGNNYLIPVFKPNWALAQAYKR